MWKPGAGPDAQYVNVILSPLVTGVTLCAIKGFKHNPMPEENFMFSSEKENIRLQLTYKTF